MMRVRFFHHPDRFPEWVMGVTTLGWGLTAFVDSLLVNVTRHMMDSPFFVPLTSTGIDQRGWGVTATLIGIVRLTCLVVNGSRPRGSTTLRAIGAGASAVLWCAFIEGTFYLPWITGAAFFYGALLVFDTAALWKAAREIAPAYTKVRLSRGGV